MLSSDRWGRDRLDRTPERMAMAASYATESGRLMSRHIDPQRPGPHGRATPHRRVGCRCVAALAILLGGIGPATGPAHSQAARTGRALGSRASIVREENHVPRH